MSNNYTISFKGNLKTITAISFENAAIQGLFWAARNTYNTKILSIKNTDTGEIKNNINLFIH